MNTRYLKDHLYSLPPTNDPAGNPIRLFRLLDGKRWRFFLVGLLAWTWDAFDFYTVSIYLPTLASYFHKGLEELSLAVTLVLMLRPIGAAVFGLAADRWGRRWPFIINNILLIVFELCTGFCKTYKQFMAVRALFGIAMGGIYGNAATTALEDCPMEARGFMSGIFQSGYPFGFLLTTLFWKAFNGPSRYEWRRLFWFAAAFPVVLIISRYFMSETDTWERKNNARPGQHSLEGILAQFRHGLVQHWQLMLYLVTLMMGVSYLSHGTQDIYPTMLLMQHHYSSDETTRILITTFIGGMVGGTVAGYCSQIVGRRFSIVVLCVLGGALIYPYTIASGPRTYVSAFFEQFCVQGIFGIIPIHLLELSPPEFNTFIVGTSYNLGLLLSSPSNTILIKIAERFPLKPSGSDYGMAIRIFMACVYVFVIIVTALGPENRRPVVDLSASDSNSHDEEQPHQTGYNLGTVARGEF